LACSVALADGRVTVLVLASSDGLAPIDGVRRCPARPITNLNDGNPTRLPELSDA